MLISFINGKLNISNQGLSVRVFLIFSIFFASFSIHASSSVEVMAFNLENLFDKFHTEGHQDFEYLPIGHPEKDPGCAKIDIPYFRKKCFSNDWDEAQYAAKLDAVIDVIRREGQVLPDISPWLKLSRNLF